jgi:hypothetical protein
MVLTSSLWDIHFLGLRSWTIPVFFGCFRVRVLYWRNKTSHLFYQRKNITIFACTYQVRQVYLANSFWSMWRFLQMFLDDSGYVTNKESCWPMLSWPHNVSLCQYVINFRKIFIPSILYGNHNFKCIWCFGLARLSKFNLSLQF